MLKRIVLATIVVGLVGGAAGIALAETYRVRATDYDTWRPAHRYITRGDRIVWRNPTNRPHDVRAYGGNWTFYRVLGSGERTGKRFWRAGTYRYRCARHSSMVDGRCEGMCGIVHVYRG